MIAAPGVMAAAILLVKNAKFILWQQVQTLFLMMTVVLLLMLCVSGIHRLIGDSGGSLIILAGVATTKIVTGISEYFGLL